jgi:hypothetical protein
MERRHEEMLTARLEEAATNGSAHILDSELHLWYGVKKLAAGTWRDIAHRWDEVVPAVRQFQPNFSDPGPLVSVEGKGGIFIFGKKKIALVSPDGEK